MNLRTVALTLCLVLLAAGCGSEVLPVAESAPEAAEDSVEAAVGDATEAASDSATEAVDDLVDDLVETQEAVGAGSATLTVGDQSWTFEGVLCAFGAEEIGQEGAEFVLSAIQDDKQMYFSIDSFGHSASINDIKDFENPSVSLNSSPSGDFITVDGKNFSGSADFRDDTADSFDTVAGTFSGTCP